MNTNNNQDDLYKLFDELDDEGRLNSHLGIDERRPYEKMSRKLAKEEAGFKRTQDDSRAAFKFTYKAARFEEWWLLEGESASARCEDIPSAFAA
ncbi:MAG: hypothetical protein HYU84_00080 [Chloroflexi bacterium]|nr:hypothetical protein [Chloroflexota bacterium]